MQSEVHEPFSIKISLELRYSKFKDFEITYTECFESKAPTSTA